MSLTSKDVEKVAHLARLAVNDDEKQSLSQSLSDILDLVEQMNQVNTDGVEPMAHPMHVAQRYRPDLVTESNQRELFQSLAPKTEAGLYLVPQVIEE